VPEWLTIRAIGSLAGAGFSALIIVVDIFCGKYSREEEPRARPRPFWQPVGLAAAPTLSTAEIDA